MVTVCPAEAWGHRRCQGGGTNDLYDLNDPPPTFICTVRGRRRLALVVMLAITTVVMGDTDRTPDGGFSAWTTLLLFVGWAGSSEDRSPVDADRLAGHPCAGAAGQEEQDLERLGREMDGEAFAPDLSRSRVHFVDPEAESRRALGIGRQGRPGGPIAVRGRWPSIKSSNSTPLGRRAMRGCPLRIRRAAAERASVEAAMRCERS